MPQLPDASGPATPVRRAVPLAGRDGDDAAVGEHPGVAVSAVRQRHDHRRRDRQGRHRHHRPARRPDVRGHRPAGAVFGRRDVFRLPNRDGVWPRPAFGDVPSGRLVLRTRDRPVRRAVAAHPHHQRRSPDPVPGADGAARCWSPHRSCAWAESAMAIHQDAGLSWLLLVSVPVLVVANYWIISNTLPMFRSMQRLIDNINRVMREQLSGVRVVRAFAREPFERRRFDEVNVALSNTAQAAGNWQALMLPVTTLTINGSSVALIWFGGLRIDSGQMHVGSLVAFLAYFTQILMAVLMATMTVMVLPRATVCAERITEVLSTTPAVGNPANPVPPVPDQRGVVRLDDASFRYPGADRRCAAEYFADRTAWPHYRDHRQHRFGKVDAGGVDLPVVRRDRRRRRCRRCRRTGPGHRRPVVDIGLVPQRGYLFSGTVAENLRYGKADATRRRDVGRAAHRGGRRIRARTPRRPADARRAGRDQLLRRATPTTGDRAGGDPPSGDLHLRRLVFRSRCAHRRAGALPAGRDQPPMRR